jgi:hypothetical protein
MAKNIPIGEWSGSDAVHELRDTIESFQKESVKQTEIMVRLTRWMMFLTIATVLLTVVQIGVATWRSIWTLIARMLT